MNTIAYFEIQASEPAKLVDFYTNVFGWKFTRDEKLPIEYYRIETGNMLGGLLQRPAKIPPPQSGTNAFTCSVQVEDFDVVAGLVMKHGGRVAMAKFAIPGKCWQGYFLDIDNNVFGVFQVDENAK
jgi:uncharacterized protein